MQNCHPHVRLTTRLLHPLSIFLGCDLVRLGDAHNIYNPRQIIPPPASVKEGTRNFVNLNRLFVGENSHV